MKKIQFGFYIKKHKKIKAIRNKTVISSFRQHSSEICKHGFEKLYLNLIAMTLRFPRNRYKIQLLAKLQEHLFASD